MKFLNILFFAIPESEYEFIRYRNKLESTAFSVLSENGANVKFLKLQEKGYTPKEPNPGEVFFAGKNKFFHFPFSMYRYIKKEKPDVLFIHSFIFPFQLLFLKYFVSSKTKIIIQHHAEKPFKHPIKHRLQKWAYSNADGFLFASMDLARSFLECGVIADRAKIHEVMEGSSLFGQKDKIQIRRKLKIDSKNVFLWVGRLDENKDPLTVLKALKQFKNFNPDFILYMIYGTSELEVEVKKFLTENDLASHVILIGKIPHVELEDWYNAADYFVAGSYYEGSGIALCEAMACGCIPLVTAIPSFISMTDHGNCGYLFEPGNPGDLYRILLRLNEKDKEMYREKVIKKYSRDLSFEAIGRKISEITSLLLGK